MRSDRIHAGLLRHRVELQRKTRTSDSQGGVTVSWHTYARPFADVRAVSGRERLQAEQLQSAVTHRAVVRYMPANDPEKDPAMPYVFAGDRLVYRGVSFDIQAVVDIDERRRWLELDLESGVGA